MPLQGGIVLLRELFTLPCVTLVLIEEACRSLRGSTRSKKTPLIPILTSAPTGSVSFLQMDVCIQLISATGMMWLLFNWL
jgi:hypothetical protein